MAEFPVREYEDRLNGLVRRMRDAGLDGMLISNRENTRYYCGLQSIIWSSKVSTPGILLVNTDGKTALIGSASAVETARHTCVLDPEDVTCYNRNRLPGIPATYPDAIAVAVRDLGIDRGRIGMELGEGCYLQLQLHWFEELVRLLPNVEFVDAARLIFSQRAIKSEAEMHMLAHACEQNELSLKYAFEHVEPGAASEMDFFRLYAQEAFRRHCENVTNDLAELSVRFGPQRCFHFGSPAGETAIERLPHAPLQVEGGLYTHGYYSNLSRTGVVGELTQEQRDLASAAAEAQALALSLIRDGADAAAVTDAVDRLALSTPVADAYLTQGALGFSVGLDLSEPPYVKKMARRGEAFRAGMVLSIAPRFGRRGCGVFGNSKTIAVTPEGCRELYPAVCDPYIL